MESARVPRYALLPLLFAAVVFTLPALSAEAPATYKSKCAPCHGVDGAGETPMGRKLLVRDLRSQEVQKQTDAVLLDVIVKGKQKMPAYGGKMPDAELKALVAHIRTFKKP